jgi:hypothetical protein
MTERRLGDKRRVTPDNWHAYICTPAYDGKVDCDYSQSLAEAAYCAPLYQVQITAGVMGNGAFIELARNVFVKKFLEEFKDCTHLFFIDADLKFPPNAFIGLIRAGLPICAGVYRRRQEPEDYPATWTQHPELGGLWLEEGFLMCDRVPTGFLCISRKVLEEMSADAPKVKIHGQGEVPWLFYTKMDDQNRFVGEDFSFCDDYRTRYGKPIHVWPDIDFVHGGHKGNFLRFIERQIEIEEQKKGEAA